MSIVDWKWDANVGRDEDTAFPADLGFPEDTDAMVLVSLLFNRLGRMVLMGTLHYDEAVVIWDLGGGDELVIGTAEMPSKGGHTARYEEEYWGPTYDQFGNTPVDQIKVGETAEATVNMAAWSLDAFAKLFPAAELVTDSSDPTKKVVRFGGKIGESLLSYAKSLTFRRKTLFDPNDGSLGDASEDVTFLKALPRANMEITFAPQTERVYPVTFVGVVDQTTGKIVAFGDNSATPAS